MASGATSEVDVAETPRVRAAAPSLLWRGTSRWLAISAVMAIFFFVYQRHPYYQRLEFVPFRSASFAFFGAWLVLGLPYALLTVRRFDTVKVWLTDPALHYMLLARALRRGVFRGAAKLRNTEGTARFRSLRRALRARRVRTSLLALGVKGFFVPLMTIFLSGHLGSLFGMWARGHGIKPFVVHAGDPAFSMWLTYARENWTTYLPEWSDVTPAFAPREWTLEGVRHITDYYYDVLFAIDCGWSLMGYLSESRWLGNKTKSVEPTGLGWLVALMCYPPFNDVTGVYFPLGGGPQHFSTPLPGLVCRIVMLGAFTIYVAATLAFGLKFSNLTNRGIVSRGPYRFVRHPAYVCKGFAWWMENLPTLTFQTAIFLVMVNGVYAMRAWTEERHLSRDPAYRAYKKKVRWVLVPGIW